MPVLKAPLERDIQAKCGVFAKVRGCVMLKLLPILTGLPDCILLVPAYWKDTPGGNPPSYPGWKKPAQLVFVEFKRPGKQLTPRQQWWRTKLTDMGFTFWRIDDPDKFREALLQLMGGRVS